MAGTAFKDLREYLSYLEKRGVIRHISAAVSPVHEIAEITSRAAHLPGGGPALWFESFSNSATESPFPVLTNLVASPQRLAWSLSLNSLKELESVLPQYYNAYGSADLLDRLMRIGETSSQNRFAPRLVRSAPAQEVVSTATAALDELPILTAWPGESGPALRSVPIIFRPDSDENAQVGCVDVINAGQDYFISGIPASKQRSFPAALVIGGEPSFSFIARAPFLPEIDRLSLAGALARHRLEMVRAREVELEVPANAEIILEGMLEAVPEAPSLQLVQANGYYGPAAASWRFVPRALTHRKEALFVASVIGPPPHEELALLKGSERLLLPLLKATAPEITDWCLPLEGTIYNLAIVAINKSYAGQAQKVMYGLWGREELKFLKHILVVDTGCDIHNPSAVVSTALALLDPERALTFAKGPLAASDLVAQSHNFGSKVGLDATRPLAGEKKNSSVQPIQAESSTGIKRQVDERWFDLGIE